MQLHRTDSLALFTDLYQLTMAYGYWKLGIDRKEVIFHQFFRRSPFHGGFTIAAGLALAIDFIQNFRFSDSDLTYLSTLENPDGQPLFCQEFLTHLSKMSFTGSIDAVPEGTVVFPYEPLLRIQGALAECQILETPLLNLINFSSLIATKAARISLAAKGDPVIEFGARRAQGIDGALTASRAAYLGGCHSTSNVLAGKLFGIPVRGTHSHSWVMAFDDELESFKAYAQAMPDNCLFLVDTYDSLQGVQKAIEVGCWLRDQGKKLLGIRLDSGDLADLSIKSREMLDAAGFKDAVIVASNDLDETLVSELKRQGAQIGVWGIGTHLITGKDQPALDGVYKLSAIRDPNGEWDYKLKLSEQLSKVSNPGILQVRRFFSNGHYLGDAIYDIRNHPKNTWRVIDPLDVTKERAFPSGMESKDLLMPIYREGKLVYQTPSLHDSRRLAQDELSHFTAGIKRFLNPHQYFYGMEKGLNDLKIGLIRDIRHQIETKIHHNESTTSHRSTK